MSDDPEVINPEVVAPEGPPPEGQPNETEKKPISFSDMVATGGGDSTLPVVHNEEEETEVSTRFRTWTATPKFDAEDLSYPKLRLAQGTTPEVQTGKAQAGDWVLSGYPPMKEVVFIPVRYTKVREYRDKDDNRKILCQSKDTVIGEGSPGGLCDACLLSQWGGTQDKRIPPACNLIYSYIGWSPTHESIVIMEFKKTAKGVANFLNVNIQNKGLGNFAVSLTSQSQQNDRKQTYYAPVVGFASVSQEIAEKAQKALTS